MVLSWKTIWIGQFRREISSVWVPAFLSRGEAKLSNWVPLGATSSDSNSNPIGLNETFLTENLTIRPIPTKWLPRSSRIRFSWATPKSSFFGIKSKSNDENSHLSFNQIQSSTNCMALCRVSGDFERKRHVFISVSSEFRKIMGLDFGNLRTRVQVDIILGDTSHLIIKTPQLVETWYSYCPKTETHSKEWCPKGSAKGENLGDFSRCKIWGTEFFPSEHQNLGTIEPSTLHHHVPPRNFWARVDLWNSACQTKCRMCT